jgi:hypothetical protein|tara:strand:+ start:1244 stop:2560 length:1317 start_codon:yes stop_codon:yes gene_type:complete
MTYFPIAVDPVNLDVNTAQIEGGQFLTVVDIIKNRSVTGYLVTVYKNKNESPGKPLTSVAFPDAISEELTIQDVFVKVYADLYPEKPDSTKDEYPILTTNPSLGYAQLEEVTVKPAKETRNKRNQRKANKKIKASTIDPNDINTAAPEDAKPQGLQRLGKFIVKLFLQLKDLFLPQIEGLINKYGINQLNQAITEGLANEEKLEELKEKYCPAPEELEALIFQRNNLAEVLNGVGDRLNTISSAVNFSGNFAELLQSLVSGLKGAQFVLNQAAKFIALIPGAVVALITDLGTIAGTTLFKSDGTPIIPKIQSIVSQVAPPFALIQSTIVQCVELLDRLDILIELCAPNATLTPTSKIIDGIFATQLIAEDTTTGNTYKGFILEIETRAYTPKVNQNRAVGKNNSGIVLIFTKYSFASDPNVLIDELKSIIDRDNLKAY